MWSTLGSAVNIRGYYPRYQREHIERIWRKRTELFHWIRGCSRLEGLTKRNLPQIGDFVFCRGKYVNNNKLGKIYRATHAIFYWNILIIYQPIYLIASRFLNIDKCVLIKCKNHYKVFQLNKSELLYVSMLVLVYFYY